MSCKKNIQKIAIVISFACLSACGTKLSDAIKKVNNGQLPLKQMSSPPPPVCVMDFADYTLDENLISFEITDKRNINFGFNLLKGFLRAFGIKINSQKGQMMMSMHLGETVNPSGGIADVMGEGEFKSKEFGFNIDLLRLGAEFDYFKQTPVSELTANTITSGLGNLRQRLDKVELPWTSRIVYAEYSNDQYIVPVGKVAGLRIGDQFKFFNIDYIWKGSPCASELLFQRKTTPQSIALGTIVQLEENAALIQVYERNYQDPIQLGAQIVPYKLPLAPNEQSRTLARSVRMGRVESAKLPIENADSVTLELFLSKQTASLLNGYNLYPRK